MKRFLNELIYLFKETFHEWRKHHPFLIAAAISYYILLLLGPLLVITIVIVGSIIGGKFAEGEVINEIHTLVGPKMANLLQAIIEKAYKPPSKTLSTLISLPLMMLGATIIFFQLQYALNVIWEVKSKRHTGLIGFIKDYLFSFIMVLIVGLLLFLLILKSSIFVLLGTYLHKSVPFYGFIMQTLDLFFTFGFITLLFALIYKILPETKIKWSDVWIGAIATSLLFLIGQLLIGMYISKIDIISAYSAIGSFSVLFIWIFYSSLIFLLGAQFTKVYSRKFGSFPH